MPEYQLELKQLVDYPRCRIYRKFIQSLIADRSFHSRGGSGLFYYVVLSSLANFRSSYQRIERISYLVHPGEWICTLSDLTANLRLKRPRQTLQVLERLQKQHYITFMAYAVYDRVLLMKLYPEQAAQVRFPRSGHGVLYICCNSHGLFSVSL